MEVKINCKISAYLVDGILGKAIFISCRFQKLHLAYHCPHILFQRLTAILLIIPPGHYRILGHSIYIDYLKQQLEDEGVVFSAVVREQPADVSVEVQADTVYIQVSMRFLRCLLMEKDKHSGESY